MVTAATGIVAPMAEMGGALYFVGYDSTYGAELWRSDGTGPGTYVVRDLAPGPESAVIVDGASAPLVAAGGRLWFSAHSPPAGSSSGRATERLPVRCNTPTSLQGPLPAGRGGWSRTGDACTSSPTTARGGRSGGRLPPSVTVADVHVEEGDSPGQSVALTLRLSSPTSSPLTVSYSTADGTALAGLDYVADGLFDVHAGRGGNGCRHRSVAGRSDGRERRGVHSQSGAARHGAHRGRRSDGDYPRRRPAARPAPAGRR